MKNKKAITAIEKLLTLEYTKPENKMKMVKALKNLKWLNGKKLDMDTLETCYKKVTKKYPIRIAYVQSHTNSMTFMIKNFNNHHWVYTVYADTFYEGLAKTLLVLYAYIVFNHKFKEGEKDEG